MEAINCDECNKERCPQRIAGALCSLNNETALLIKTYETRDPILISRYLIEVQGEEVKRYRKAIEMEKIGETKTKQILTKTGFVEIEQEQGPNPDITNLAKSIVRNGKVISDIVNPPKAAPMFQSNIQYNFGSSVVSEISTLSEKEQLDTIKFIDEKLNA